MVKMREGENDGLLLALKIVRDNDFKLESSDLYSDEDLYSAVIQWSTAMFEKNNIGTIRE